MSARPDSQTTAAAPSATAPCTAAADQDLDRALAALSERGVAVTSCDHLAGDLSRRHYVRLELAAGCGGARRAILALYPLDDAPVCHRYARTGELLTAAGVRVAEVYDRSCDDGWMLIEDLGEKTLYETAERPWEELEGWFRAALAAMGRIATLAPEEVAPLSPPLDRELLERELRQTVDAFLVPVGLPPGPALQRALRSVCANLADETPIPCHRDFGARNLVPLETGDGRAEVGVLDHQDLRMGPPAYDLASLLNDSLLPPPEVEEHLLLAAGLATDRAGRAARESYHRAAVQRTLKAIGSYATSAARGNRRHVPLIAPTLERTLRHMARVPETTELVGELEVEWGSVLSGDASLPERVA